MRRNECYLRSQYLPLFVLPAYNRPKASEDEEKKQP
jgi:hypothetical protein